MKETPASLEAIDPIYSVNERIRSIGSGLIRNVGHLVLRGISFSAVRLTEVYDGHRKALHQEPMLPEHPNQPVRGE